MMSPKPIQRFKACVSAALCGTIIFLSPGLECYAQTSAVVGGQVRSGMPKTAPPMGITAGMIQPVTHANFLSPSFQINIPTSGVLKTAFPNTRIITQSGASRTSTQKTNLGAIALPKSKFSAPSSIIKGKASPQIHEDNAVTKIQRPATNDSVLTKLEGSVRLLNKVSATEHKEILDDIYVHSAGVQGIASSEKEENPSPIRMRLLSADAGQSRAHSHPEIRLLQTSQTPQPSRWRALTRIKNIILRFYEANKTWQGLTKLMVLTSGAIFSGMQIPQIRKNFINLISGHAAQLSILPWIGYSTGMLGNMLLLAYFRSIGDKATATAQVVSIITSAVVICQIFAAGFMPLPAFVMVLTTMTAGLALNWLDQKGRLPKKIWGWWDRGLSLLGLAILPQALWASFASLVIPIWKNSLIPLAVGAVMALALDYLNRHRPSSLPSWLKKLWTTLGAWTATALFGYGAIAQHVNNILNPTKLSEIAITTILLGLAGNMLLMPRMMHTHNSIGIKGNAWAIVIGAWGMMIWLFAYGLLSPLLFWGATALIPAFLGFTAWMNHKYPYTKD